MSRSPFHFYPNILQNVSHISRGGCPLSHGLYHFFYRSHRIPGIVSAAGGALEKTVIALYFCDLLLGKKLYKLCILVWL